MADDLTSPPPPAKRAYKRKTAAPQQQGATPPPNSRVRAPQSDLRGLAAARLREILEQDTRHDLRARDVQVRAAQVAMRADPSELLEAMTDDELLAHAEAVRSEAVKRGLVQGG